ncbi:hypothetical protein [Sphingomonas sp. 3-13AW]|uniref:hypothetical protein n=1 Tax=Sphingomonas sp. 3-13AW TaxID=3050450 RepID=UPI003BB5BF12
MPASTYRDAYCDPPPGSEKVERAEAEAFLDAYRRTPRHYDQEALAEMRSVFGEGATVVDVFSGQRTRL